MGEISTDPEAVEEVKQIRETLANITRQLQAIRISTGSLSINKLDYPAGDFFEDLRERFEKKNQPQKIGCSGESRSTVKFYFPSIQNSRWQRFMNCSGNAMLFGPAGGTMEFSASVDGTSVAAVLSEVQPEAPAVDLGAWGCQPLLSTRRGGYGLGLFRVRRIIESQGGQFAVEHSADNKMLISRITLPIAGLP